MPVWNFILVGLAAGVLAGFFGVGGGILIVPLLLFFGMSQHEATGTSLVALVLPVGILGILNFYKAGKIGPEHIRYGLWIALGLFFGAFAGSKIAVALPGETLKKAFAIFLVAAAVKIFFTR